MGLLPFVSQTFRYARSGTILTVVVGMIGGGIGARSKTTLALPKRGGLVLFALAVAGAAVVGLWAHQSPAEAASDLLDMPEVLAVSYPAETDTFDARVLHGVGPDNPSALAS